MSEYLRDRYEAFQERFGTAGVIVAVIALIAALSGTAIAAGGLSSKQKKEVTKIAKKYAGKPGAQGPQGAAGPQGPKGDNGNRGNNGADGKSVTVASEPKGANCKEAGAKVEVEGSGSPKFVCNGSPWTAGGTLPKEATETGYYSTVTNQSAGQTLVPSESNIVAPVSFSIQLAAALDKAHTIFVPEGNTSTAHCSASPVNGTAQNPKAESGYLCVYALSVENLEPSPGFITVFGTAFKRYGAKSIAESTGSDKTGTSLILNIPAAGLAQGVFTWAVTG